MGYDSLFKMLLTHIRDALEHQEPKPKLVIIPSHKDVHHTYPLPCPPFKPDMLPRGIEIIPMGNPTIFTINDITFGVINADAVKDICLNMILKNKEVPGGKMALAYEALLQQRNFFPLLPGSEKTPIDYEQWKQMSLPVLPDILIVPAELKLSADLISGCLCVNPGKLA